MSVDALVADIVEFPSRSSTPSVPPGFLALPHAHPLPPALGEDTIPKLQSRIDPTSATFTPSHISSHAPRAATPLSNVLIPVTPTQVPASTQGYTKPKQDVKHSATAATSLPRNMAIELSAKPSSSSLQLEDFPALESSKTRQAAPAKVVNPAKAAIFMAVNKKQPTPTLSTAAVPFPGTKPNDKRPPPDLPNISVPGKSTSGATEGVVNPGISSSAFPPLSASTPSAVPLQSPIARGSSAKILRLASTSRTEIPVAMATPSSATSTHACPFPPSRQPSLASMSRQDRPGTPTSEMTDNASTASAPLSRTSSPPPMKIGSAPLRTTTKSMQKKQRAQKAKERELSTVAPVEPEPEPEIAPIQGRKKKQKKERTGGSTPVVSRPPSPRIVSEPANLDSVPPAPTTQPPQTSDKQALTENDQENKAPDLKGKGKAKVQPPVATEPAPTATRIEEPTEKPIPTPASVLQDLVSSGIISDVFNLNFLKAPHTNNSRNQELLLQADLENAIPKLTITPDDRTTLLSGRLVHKNPDGPNRIMLTPNGDCLRNLIPEEEARYLILQSRIAREIGPATFFSAKHHASNGFTLIGGRAVPNGPPTFFPQSSSIATPMDPVSKIQRDEALSYINQYVLPSLSTNSQLEKALNANALDTETIRPSESSAWAPWSNDPMPPRMEYTNSSYGTPPAHSQEGILATGLEGITAHFAVGRDIDRGQPLSNVTLLSLRDAETAMQAARKETEGLEKRFNALLKKNRRLLLGSGN